MDVRADPARTRTPCLVCFFLVIRRPPRSTLFPTRRSSDPRIASLLMMAGLLGLYVEFTHPGLAFPGVAGAICLILGLAALHVLPVNTSALALLLLGVALLVAEAFLPTFGVVGAGGLIAFV